MSTQLPVTLGPALFGFDSFDHWCDTAQRIYREFYEGTGKALHDTLALDRAGRVCATGREYMRARDEGTYPVTVYAIDPAGVGTSAWRRQGVALG